MRIKRILAAGAAAAVIATPFLSTSAMAAPAAPSVPTAPDTANPVLHPGDRGPAVKKLQQRLKALHFDPGTIDGVWGQGQSMTTEAVWAFEEVNHFAVSDSPVFGAKMWKALANPVVPKVHLWNHAKTGVGVDLTHQVLYLWKSGKLQLISHVSTGRSSYWYTPTGHFHVYRKAYGWERSSLGLLWKANYFYQGWAIHGEPDTPDYPASHGCVRTPMHTSNILSAEIPVGMLVVVYR